MKTLEELKEMREQYLNARKDDEDFEKYSTYNFVAYNCEDDNVRCYEDYASAKNYAEFGGQVLVLNTEKIYTYKIKNEEEIREYLKYQIKNDGYAKMNRYGL